jgi:hypothetical protein
VGMTDVSRAVWGCRPEAKPVAGSGCHDTVQAARPGLSVTRFAIRYSHTNSTVPSMVNVPPTMPNDA